MLPAPTYNDLVKMLNQDRAWGEHGPLQTIEPSKGMLGVLFLNQNLADATIRDFVANIDTLNEHSGKYIHFILAGLSRYRPNNEGAGKELCTLDGVPLFFNPGAFRSFVDVFEANLEGWNADYGMDLVLVNLAGERPNRRVDFRGAIFFKLDEFVDIGICDKSSRILGRIIKLCRENKLYDVHQIQEMFAVNFGVNWFKGLVLGMFPTSVQQLARAKAVLGGGRALPH